MSFPLLSPFIDLHLEDSGLYTCTAISESGETSWSSWLTVSKLNRVRENLQFKLKRLLAEFRVKNPFKIAPFHCCITN